MIFRSRPQKNCHLRIPGSWTMTHWPLGHVHSEERQSKGSRGMLVDCVATEAQKQVSGRRELTTMRVNKQRRP